MSDLLPEQRSEIILYQTEDGQSRIQVRLEGATVWLTQALMAELFQTTPQNITIHIRGIYKGRELAEEGTCKESLQVRWADEAARADEEFDEVVKKFLPPGGKGKKKK